MPQGRKAAILVGSVLAGLLLVALTVVVATLGGFLNHCSGGYVHFGPANSSSSNWYWSQHIFGRLLFAVPTGLAVVSCSSLSNSWLLAAGAHPVLSSMQSLF